MSSSSSSLWTGSIRSATGAVGGDGMAKLLQTGKRWAKCIRLEAQARYSLNPNHYAYSLHEVVVYDSGQNFYHPP